MEMTEQMLLFPLWRKSVRVSCWYHWTVCAWSCAWWFIDTSPSVLWLFVPSSGWSSIYRAVLSMSWTCRKEHRNVRAPREGDWCGQEPHPGLHKEWAGTPLLLCFCMKHSPPRSWLRHESAFIQEKLPARLIATTFALFPQGLCWCRQRLPVGNANHFMLDKKR